MGKSSKVESLRPVDLRVGPGEITVEGRSFELKRPRALPFLKWAGGKQWLARVAYLFPSSRLQGTYFEPFLGGGSIFLALAPSSAVLSDSNHELIATYRAVAADPQSVITELKSYPHCRDFFNRLRLESPTDPHRVAARLIYLNKTAWNGLYRVNLKGKFNVPFGRFGRITICPEERLLKASKCLRSAILRCCDFETATTKAREGDFVYFDPPYITTHANNGFRRYNAKLFSWADQLRLSRLAQRLRGRGVHVVVSNADHQPLVDLFQGFHCYRISRNSLIGSSLSSRQRAAEVLLTSFPLDFEAIQEASGVGVQILS